MEYTEMNAIASSVKNAVIAASVAVFKEEDLIKADRTLAIKSIEDALVIQSEIDKKSQSVNKLIHVLVKRSVEHTTKNGVANLPNARAYFVALCAAAEGHAKAKDNEARQKAGEEDGGERSIAKICPTWAVYKSQFLAGLDNGLNPFDRTAEDAPKYNTPAKYLNEVAAIKKERAARTTDGTKDKAPDQKVISLQGIKMGLEAGLSTAMAQLYSVLRKLSIAEQIVATQMVAGMTDQLEKLHAATAPAADAAQAPAHKGEKA